MNITHSTRWGALLCVTFSFNLAWAETKSRQILVSEAEYRAIMEMRANAKKSAAPETSAPGVASASSQLSDGIAPVPLLGSTQKMLRSALEREQGLFPAMRNDLTDYYPAIGGLKERNAVEDTALGEKGVSLDNFLGGLRLRESIADIKAYRLVNKQGELYVVENKQSQDEAKGAFVEWAWDGQSDSETWNAKGALYFPFSHINQDGPGFTGTKESWGIYYPAIRFNRDTSKDGTEKEINTLDFMFGVDWNLYRVWQESAQDSEGLQELDTVFHAAVGYRTNFDFDGGEPLFEFDYIPVDDCLTENLGVNLFPIVKDRFAHKLNFVPGLRLGSHLDQIAKKALAGERFTAFEIKAGYACRPNWFWAPFRDFEFDANYHGRLDIEGDAEYLDYFQIGLRFSPFRAGTANAAFRIDYINGTDFDSLEEEEQLKVHLEVKF